jgi:hypothetical protein
MSYPINKSNGELLVTLEDGQLNTATSLGLVGRNYVGYGEVQNENLLHLLENFASSGPPASPITGQLWFSTTQKIVNVYDGSAKSWNPVGSATVAQGHPISPITGQLWFDSINQQLNVYSGSGWVVAGPESIANFGETKAKSAVLIDTLGTSRPVILLVVDQKVVAIVATGTFKIGASSAIIGFENIIPGVTVSNQMQLAGDLTGNADYAKRLLRTSTINGVGFDGATDITITANASHLLKNGNYLLGSNFNGSSEVTLAVNADTANTANTVVARDGSGAFSAGVISATFAGVINAPAISTCTFDKITVNSLVGSTISGNATTASKLSPGVKINTVSFDGSVDVTIPSDAGTLTGAGLNPTVVDSKLRTLGVLQSLQVGSSATVALTAAVVSTIPTLSTTTGKLTVSAGVSGASLTFNDTANGGRSIIPSADTNLGSTTAKFDNVYATKFNGVATSAYYADLAENYVADAPYAPGMVVEFGGLFEITIGSQHTARVAGVVSTNPAHLMNAHQDGEFVVAVALQGKVPCNVTGCVSKGDLMVSSGAGYARAEKHPVMGAVIGKSLEDFNGEFGVITIVVGRV